MASSPPVDVAGSQHSTSSPLMFQDKVVVVTGGASGIGKALAQAFVQDGAKVAVVDRRNSHEAVQDIQRSCGKSSLLALTCNVTDATQIQQMIATVKQTWGRVDIYCSNAGIIYPPTLNTNVAKHSDEQWANIMRVNVQSHVIAARILLADWEKGPGRGIFCITASAAGLLTQIADASYGVSKAAAVSFAEHLAIAHSDNVQVHCLCPQAVDTPFVAVKSESNSAMADGMVSADYVADCTLQAIHQNNFWIFPHPQVPEYVRRKAMDHARWLKGMQRLQKRLLMANASDTRIIPAKL